MTTSKSNDSATPGPGAHSDDRRQPDDPPSGDQVVGEADEESFPASDAPGWITQTTIGPPARGRMANTERSADHPSGGGTSPEDHCRRDPEEEEASDGGVDSGE